MTYGVTISAVRGHLSGMRGPICALEGHLFSERGHSGQRIIAGIGGPFHVREGPFYAEGKSQD